MRCRHENAEHMMPGDASTPDWCVQIYAEVEQFRCIDCGAWLPLGPANDEPEAVKMEILGAAFAADWADQRYRPGCDRFDWCPAYPDGDHLCEVCEARYVAHAIAAHDSRGEK